MAMPNLPTHNQEHLQREVTSHKVQVGMKSDGTPLYVRVTDDGYMLTKLMALDTEISNVDVQVSCDAQGRLLSSGTLNAYVDGLEQEILDTLDHYKLSDWLVASATVTYVGYVAKDGKWYVKKIDSSAHTVTYVKGDSGYSFSNPASLTPYANFATTF